MKPYILFTFLIFLVITGGCRDNAFSGPAEEDQTIAQVKESGEFISPSAGDKWIRGSTYRIEWRDFSPDNNVDLILLKKKYYYPVEILINSPNLGSFTWKVPDDLKTSTYYQLKLVRSNSPGNFIYSQPFVIK